tara:strand:- start:19 stop:288 length:270 start_codon:yes stop_codon:yes gene_type:complete
MKTEKINENSIKLTNSKGDSFVLYDSEGFYNDFFEKDECFKFSLQGVSQQRELLLAYEQSKCPKTWWMSKSQAECEVDDFLANNIRVYD